MLWLITNQELYYNSLPIHDIKHSQQTRIQGTRQRGIHLLFELPASDPVHDPWVPQKCLRLRVQCPNNSAMINARYQQTIASPTSCRNCSCSCSWINAQSIPRGCSRASNGTRLIPSSSTMFNNFAGFYSKHWKRHQREKIGYRRCTRESWNPTFRVAIILDPLSNCSWTYLYQLRTRLLLHATRLSNSALSSTYGLRPLIRSTAMAVHPK